MEKVRIVMRLTIALWFILLNIFIFIPSIQIISDIKNDTTSKKIKSIKPPTPPPDLPTIKLDTGKAADQQINLYTQNISLYTQKVNIYNQQMTLYKARLELAAKSTELEKYKAVTTDTLVPILTTFVVTFLGWVFANAGTGLAERFMGTRLNNLKSDNQDDIMLL